MIVACLAASGAARAEETEKKQVVELSAAYTSDIAATVSGGADHRARYLDALDLVADVDLDALAGWRGGMVHVDVLNTLGKVPNDSAGTLQGVNNIEVSSRRLRLFEAWIEQTLATGITLRAGLYDLNSEFYANDAAGLLIGPAFGIGTEFAATGPNGPSIYPSTALAVRLRVEIAGGGYAMGSIVNAHAGVPGDRGGIDWSFDDGMLVIAEAGYAGRGKIGVGAWRYSRRQDDVRRVDIAGDPLRRTAQGAYLLAEYPLRDAEQPQAVSIFGRIGISDGNTGDFRGGWQAGILVGEVITGRKDSQFSLGVSQAALSRGFRLNQIDAGIRSGKSETQIEATYADRLMPFLTIQPDIQLILNPGADRAARNAVVTTMRFILEI